MQKEQRTQEATRQKKQRKQAAALRKERRKQAGTRAFMWDLVDVFNESSGN